MTLRMDQESLNCSISEIGLSTKPARSLEKFTSLLGRWAIVLIELSGISLLAQV